MEVFMDGLLKPLNSYDQEINFIFLNLNIEN